MRKSLRKLFPVLLAIMLAGSLCLGGMALAEAAAAVDDVVLSDDASDFVLLSEAVPDAILEIRYYSTYNFVGDRIDGYEEPLAFLTQEAAAALREVSDELVGMGYRLKIFDAYRPQMAVTHFMNWALDTDDVRMKAYFYPELDKDVLFPQGYIAEHSGHSRGSTVDLTLFDMTTEREVDMGGTFDYFGELSHPDYTDITEEQYANRMLLREVMLKHGFKPLDEEWWHFTLADEPYTDTYFTFPVNSDSLTGAGHDDEMPALEPAPTVEELEAEIDQFLPGEWLEAETPFAQMTIEKNPAAGWDVEIASPLTHGAYIFKATIQYDAGQQCFTYNKGKFWEVPITDSDEETELGEARIAGTIGAFTWDGENMALTWVDDSQPEREVRFERADAVEAETAAAEYGDAVYGFSGDETVEEQVVYDAEGVKITVTGLEIVRYAPVLELRIENGSGRRLGFSLTESALNDWMWDASLCTYEKNGGDPDDDVYCEEIDLFVEDGETLECGLGFANEYYYEPCGIVGFGEIGFTLAAFDPDSGDAVFTTPVIDVETSLGADYPGLYRDIGTLAYEGNDIRILIAGLISDEYHTGVQVYINNYSDGPVLVTAESCAVNDVQTEAWFGAQVSPGRQCLAEMGFDDGIAGIDKLAVAFRVEEYASEYTEDPAVIGVSDVVEVAF